MIMKVLLSEMIIIGCSPVRMITLRWIITVMLFAEVILRLRMVFWRERKSKGMEWGLGADWLRVG